MRVRIRWLGAALLAAGLGGGALAQAPSPAEAIAQRQTGLKRMAQHMEAIKAVVDVGGDPATIAARTADMVGWYEAMPALFPPGSDTGNGPSGPTKAAPAIWSDRTGFEQANANAVAAARRLNAVAQSGDRAALATAFREMGGTCGGCHRPYRLR